MKIASSSGPPRGNKGWRFTAGFKFKIYIIRKWSKLLLWNCVRIIFIYILFLNDDKIIRNNMNSGAIMRNHEKSMLKICFGQSPVGCWICECELRIYLHIFIYLSNTRIYIYIYIYIYSAIYACRMHICNRVWH